MFTKYNFKISGDMMLLYLCESSPLFSFKVRHNKNVPNLLITTIKREKPIKTDFMFRDDEGK